MVCFGVCAVQQICHNLALHRAIPQQRGEKILAGLPKMRFSARDGLRGINACVASPVSRLIAVYVVLTVLGIILPFHLIYCVLVCDR